MPPSSSGSIGAHSAAASVTVVGPLEKVITAPAGNGASRPALIRTVVSLALITVAPGGTKSPETATPGIVPAKGGMVSLANSSSVAPWAASAVVVASPLEKKKITDCAGISASVAVNGAVKARLTL